jgi:hypothetical protein
MHAKPGIQFNDGTLSAGTRKTAFACTSLESSVLKRQILQDFQITTAVISTATMSL